MPQQLRNNIPEIAITVLTAMFAFVMFTPETFESWPLIKRLSEFAAIGGLSALGFQGTRSFRKARATVKKRST